ncbi:MAG TPA: hypothetical protein VHI54_03020 [Actinomycetota bacterium]|nr:hypothetical protein [Actinomycetota bacterium]
MKATRRIAAVTLMVVVFAVTLLAASAGAAQKKCAPGQHGNPSPGFKPAACRK